MGFLIALLQNPSSGHDLSFEEIRSGYSMELAGAVVLLASRAGSYMKGSDILVDGGVSVL